MKYTWTLTPDLNHIDLDIIQNYSCYDDRCLISTFFRDDIFDFLYELEIDPLYSKSEDYKYKIVFDLDDEVYEVKRQKLIDFKTGRFITSSIYYFDEECEKWKKIILVSNKNTEFNFNKFVIY